MRMDPQNIFKLLKKTYPKGEPKKTGHLDIRYALFDRVPPAAPEPTMAFFTDTSICIGCKACEVACKQWNQLPTDTIEWSKNSYDNTQKLSDVNWRHVKFIERFPEKNQPVTAPKDLESLLKEAKVGEWLMMSDQCKHCQDSPCHDSCPTGAIVRNEFGGVYYQTDICMGCGMCVAACPFGVPQINPKDGHSHKCTECYDRLKDGLTPACQLACPTGSIQFGPRQEMERLARERLEVLHKQGKTQANLYGVDAFNYYEPLNSFYLLMDKPSVYGLPEQPVTPKRFMADDYLRGIGTLVICAAALAASLW